MATSVMQQSMIVWQLQQSMGEELTAGSAYQERALYAEDAGDQTTADIYREIAGDEVNDHYVKFNDRLTDIMEHDKPNLALGSSVWTQPHGPVALKIEVPKFNVGDRVTYKYNGVDATGEILELPKKIYRLGYVYRVSHPAMGTGMEEWQSERTLRLTCEVCSL